MRLLQEIATSQHHHYCMLVAVRWQSRHCMSTIENGPSKPRTSFHHVNSGIVCGSTVAEHCELQRYTACIHMAFSQCFSDMAIKKTFHKDKQSDRANGAHNPHICLPTHLPVAHLSFIFYLLPTTFFEWKRGFYGGAIRTKYRRTAIY